MDNHSIYLFSKNVVLLFMLTWLALIHDQCYPCEYKPTAPAPAVQRTQCNSFRPIVSFLPFGSTCKAVTCRESPCNCLALPSFQRWHACKPSHRLRQGALIPSETSSLAKRLFPIQSPWTVKILLTPSLWAVSAFAVPVPSLWAELWDCYMVVKVHTAVKPPVRSVWLIGTFHAKAVAAPSGCLVQRVT